jgi:hypothetical protein
MTRKNATELLSKFEHLRGSHSKTFNSEVDYICVSFQDPRLAKIHCTAMKNNVGFPHLPSDEGHYTIVGGLSNGKVVSIKSLVNNDKLEYLYHSAEALDDIYQLP